MFNAIIASYSSAGEEAMGAMFSALSSLFSSFISLAFAAAAFVGLWFVFKKMGFPGWKGIIPFYNDYVLFDTLWEKKKFVRYVVYYGITLVATVIGVIFCVFGTGLIIGGAAMYNASYSYQGAGVGMIIGDSVLTLIGFLFSVAGLVFAILLLVLQFKLMARLADAFGLKRAWAWGLTFVSPVFMLILGLHKGIVYRGAGASEQGGYTPPQQPPYEPPFGEGQQ